MVMWGPGTPGGNEGPKAWLPSFPVAPGPQTACSAGFWDDVQLWLTVCWSLIWILCPSTCLQPVQASPGISAAAMTLPALRLLWAAQCSEKEKCVCVGWYVCVREGVCLCVSVYVCVWDATCTALLSSITVYYVWTYMCLHIVFELWIICFTWAGVCICMSLWVWVCALCVFVWLSRLKCIK